ncbi:MAG TPA: nitrate- and nitrite sensing domain-containing protein, partial [Actinoplanes sp.]|nr:nitrate- and nitrite sensing domain-containing protein [Actinoplanes sp.]
MRRTWSIRSKIIALVSVPVTAMVALWIFATVLTIGPAISLTSTQTLVESFSAPGWNLLLQTQKERQLSVEFLADRNAGSTALAAQRVATDQAAALWRTNVDKDETQRLASDSFLPRLNDVVAATDGLTAVRTRVDERQIDPAEARAFYNTVPDSVMYAFTRAANFGDEATDNEIRALIMVGRGHEQLNRADSLLVEAYATGALSSTNRSQLFEAIGAADQLLNQAATELSAQSQGEFAAARNGAAMRNLDALTDNLLRSSRAGLAVPVLEAEWRDTFDRGATDLFAFQAAPAARLGEMARPKAVTVISQLTGAGAVGLLAVIVSIVVSVRIGRSIVGRLARLRAEALEMANNRLPSVVSRLRHGETLDVAAETPQLEYSSDEVGQVKKAFNAVQRTAVQSAVEEANVRRGLNEVFLNIARRSQ